MTLTFSTIGQPNYLDVPRWPPPETDTYTSKRAPFDDLVDERQTGEQQRDRSATIGGCFQQTTPECPRSDRGNTEIGES